MVFGSYMTWALYPRLKPFAEPRVELYSTQFWLRYASLCRGPKNASAQLEKDGFTQALLDPQPQNQRELVRRLGKSPRWELVLKRGPAILFGRRETPGVQ